MTEQGYASEDLLQALIARYPNILAGDFGSTPRRWLLISREVALAPGDDGDGEGAGDGGGRWSVDHLFVDQDAVPTLVEVKRSSDTFRYPALAAWISTGDPMQWDELLQPLAHQLLLLAERRTRRVITTHTEVAAAYKEAFARNEPIIETLGKKFHWEPQTVKNRIRAAREADLLPKTRPGRAQA